MENRKFLDTIVLIFAACLVILPIILYLIQFCGGLSQDQTAFGLFGDYIGGVAGTVISGISIYFIYKTYKRQVEFSEEQRRLSILQSFESSFFSLLNQHHEILLSLSQDDETGYQYIKTVADDLKMRLSSREYESEESILQNTELEREYIDEEYDSIYNLYGAQLGHYFRNLYHILLYVKDSDIADKNKYFKLIQSQLCNDELYLLFYNSISRYGRDKLYPILAECDFLENVRYSEFNYFRLHQRIFYPKTTFK